MSDPISKAYYSRIKDERQSRVPEKLVIHTKSKRARPFLIEHRYSSFIDEFKMSEWYVVGRYRTRRERDDALFNYQRKVEPFAGSRWKAEYRAADNPPKEN